MAAFFGLKQERRSLRHGMRNIVTCNMDISPNRQMACLFLCDEYMQHCRFYISLFVLINTSLNNLLMDCVKTVVDITICTGKENNCRTSTCITHMILSFQVHKTQGPSQRIDHTLVDFL